MTVRNKIVTIVGARPQFVKAAVISRVLSATDSLREILVHTGQHYDHNISGVFFEEMQLPVPAHNLGVGSGTHGQQTGRMLEAIESVLESERPNAVLVYGDTNSTLAGALAAAKLHIPVAHVEAGLRSFNRRMPEEINRVLTDHASDILFAPTELAVRNLEQEGIAGPSVIRTGDVMYDGALFYGDLAESKSRVLAELGLVSQGFVLATVHRAENTDDSDRLRSILGALSQLSDDIRVVLPVHPRTRAAISSRPDLHWLVQRLTMIDPVGYLDMIKLEKNARLIITDSGGIQKEASFQNVRCLTLRDETEWKETIDAGRNTLAPPRLGATRIAQLARASLELPQLLPTNIYGDGHAAETIVRTLRHFLLRGRSEMTS